MVAKRSAAEGPGAGGALLAVGPAEGAEDLTGESEVQCQRMCERVCCCEDKYVKSLSCIA